MPQGLKVKDVFTTLVAEGELTQELLLGVCMSTTHGAWTTRTQTNCALQRSRLVWRILRTFSCTSTQSTDTELLCLSSTTFLCTPM
jgi:hypothetical protein